MELLPAQMALDRRAAGRVGGGGVCGLGSGQRHGPSCEQGSGGLPRDFPSLQAELR